MSMADFNSQVITEFRDNAGQVGGMFEGRPMLLLHHVGAKSGAGQVHAPLDEAAGEVGAEVGGPRVAGDEAALQLPDEIAAAVLAAGTAATRGIVRRWLVTANGRIALSA